MRLDDVIKVRKLTQTRVAENFGIRQPHVFRQRNFKLSRFSSERRLQLIAVLDKEVEITIRPRRQTTRPAWFRCGLATESSDTIALVLRARLGALKASASRQPWAISCRPATGENRAIERLRPFR
jgi:hypothetical protein